MSWLGRSATGLALKPESEASSSGAFASPVALSVPSAFPARPRFPRAPKRFESCPASSPERRPARSRAGFAPNRPRILPETSTRPPCQEAEAPFNRASLPSLENGSVRSLMASPLAVRLADLTLPS